MYYKIRRFLLDIPYNLKKIKWFFQRGSRGWADCDWWDMSGYLIGIILPMLKELREYQHGYPGIGNADTPEKWDAILDQMILGFGAGKRVSDDEYFMETNDDILTRKPTSDEIRGWGDKSRKDQEIFDRGVELFTEWYWALWD